MTGFLTSLCIGLCSTRKQFVDKLCDVTSVSFGAVRAPRLPLLKQSCFLVREGEKVPNSEFVVCVLLCVCVCVCVCVCDPLYTSVANKHGGTTLPNCVWKYFVQLRKCFVCRSLTYQHRKESGAASLHGVATASSENAFILRCSLRAVEGRRGRERARRAAQPPQVQQLQVVPGERVPGEVHHRRERQGVRNGERCGCCCGWCCSCFFHCRALRCATTRKRTQNKEEISLHSLLHT